MLGTVVALMISQSGLANEPVPPQPVRTWGSRFDSIKETVASYLITPNMTGSDVEKLMGLPFGVDTHGPPGEAVTVFSYLESRVYVTFGADGKVMAVRRK